MPDQEAPIGAWNAAYPQNAPAPQQPAPPPPAPWLPVSPNKAAQGPPVKLAPERGPDAGKNWNAQNLPMTTEVHQKTKPYFDVVQNLGREFKASRQTSFDAKQFVKKNPDASLDDITARFNKVNQNKAHVSMASAMNKTYRNVETPEAFARIKANFERDYANIRNLVNRPPSALEQALPENSPLRTRLDPLTGAFRDPKTSLYADLKTVGEGPNAKQVMVFGGTGVGKMSKQQLIADGQQVAGKIPTNYHQALELATTVQSSLKQANPNVAFETAGHSLGGGLANYAGLKLQVPMTCFNAAALGKGCRDDIGAEKLDRAKQLATHVNIKGEAISDGAALGPLNLRKAVDKLTPNSVAPHQYGQSYQMEHAKINPIALHLTNSIEEAYHDFAQANGLQQNQNAPAVHGPAVNAPAVDVPAVEGPALNAPAVNAPAPQGGWLPVSPNKAANGPAVKLAPERGPDAGKNWNAQNLPMTAEVHQKTKPYFDVVQNLGREFKASRQTSFDAKQFVKKNPDASLDDITARFNKVNENKAHVSLAGAMNKAYRNVETPEAFAKIKANFERDYANIRNLVNRPPSALEQALPENSPLRTRLDPLTGAFRDPKTSLYADLKTVGEGPNAKQVMVFGGTGVGKMSKQQLIADGQQVAGKIPSNYHQALELATTVQNSLKQANPNVAFETAGHSLGGGLANYAGLKLQVPMTCFNAAALGKGCREDIGAEKLDRAKQLATHVNIKGEAISDGAALGPLNLRKAVDKLTPNSVAPHQYGQSYQMEHAKINPIALHLTNSIEEAYHDFAQAHDLQQKQNAPAVNGPAGPVVQAPAAQLDEHPGQPGQGQGPPQAAPQWQAAVPSPANLNMDAGGLAVEGVGAADDLGGQAMNGPQGPDVGAQQAANLQGQVPAVAASQVANVAAQEGNLGAGQVAELNEDAVGIVKNQVEEVAAEVLPQVAQDQEQEQPNLAHDQEEEQPNVAENPAVDAHAQGQAQAAPAKKTVREMLLGNARAQYQPKQGQGHGQGMGGG